MATLNMEARRALCSARPLPEHDAAGEWERSRGLAHWVLRDCRTVHLTLRDALWVVWREGPPPCVRTPHGVALLDLDPPHIDERAAYTLADATKAAHKLAEAIDV